MPTENYVKCLRIGLKVPRWNGKCGIQSQAYIDFPLSSCFVATYDNIIVLRNEGKGTCIPNFFSGYFPPISRSMDQQSFWESCGNTGREMTVYKVYSPESGSVGEVISMGVTGKISKRGNLGQNCNQEMGKNLTGSE